MLRLIWYISPTYCSRIVIILVAPNESKFSFIFIQWRQRQIPQALNYILYTTNNILEVLNICAPLIIISEVNVHAHTHCYICIYDKSEHRQTYPNNTGYVLMRLLNDVTVQLTVKISPIHSHKHIRAHTHSGMNVWSSKGIELRFNAIW